ncbi:hypothetical protein HDU90_003590 [Geranomyces variabilis]|nr:hypothetical protein HDU90_003590 [Geranomyces variabilis]
MSVPRHRGTMPNGAAPHSASDDDHNSNSNRQPLLRSTGPAANTAGWASKRTVAMSFLALALLVFLTLRSPFSSSSPANPFNPPPITTAGRIIAIGDLHGDYANALHVFRLAGLTDANGDWIGEQTTLVQTGDVVDRGPDTIRLYKWLERLEKQAEEAGGRVIALLGNHEVMNLLQDLRYVTPEDTASFGGAAARIQAWSATGWLGSRLRTLPIVAHVSNTVFLHGGLHPRWAVRGIDGLNNDTRNAFATMSDDALRRLPLFHGDGPLWYRGYAQDDERVACPLLESALKAVNATRMVLGHTPQLDTGKVLSRCGGRVYIIDVGISAVYGGNHAALEIIGNRVVGLHDDGPEVLVEG